MCAKSRKDSDKKNDAIDRPFDPEVLRRAADLAPQYRLVLEQEEDGFGATVFEMPNVYGFGETVDACIKETRELLESALAFMMESGEAIPLPSAEPKRTEQVNIRLTPDEKWQLEEAARRQGFRGVSDYVRSATLHDQGAAGRWTPTKKTSKKK